MKKEHLKILVCPECQQKLFLEDYDIENNNIKSGTLICEQKHSFKIIRGVPRFIKLNNYSYNFGIQWNFFDKVQIDKFSKNSESKKRYEAELSYENNWIKDNTILDVGCGAGRFLEHSVQEAKLIVGVDLSNSVEAAYKNFGDQENILIIQADLYKLPFPKNFFDGIYSIGVIQHTPDPKKSILTILNFIKKGGVLGFTMYEKKKWTLYNGKYLIRHITKYFNPKFTLFFLIISMPILFPITQLLFKIPIIGKLLSFIIPVCDYSKVKDINIKHRYLGVLLDTFDMLAPTYDQPLSKKEIKKLLLNRVSKVRHNAFNYKASGINVVGTIE